MKKNELKQLIHELYENLINSIDEKDSESDDISKDQVLNYLLESAHIISEIEDDASSMERAKLTFTNRYKEIAKTSLSSYENTNGKFQELAKMQRSTIESCKEDHIDLDSITNKFTEIQDHMTEEVSKANQIISNLKEQVKTLEKTSNLDSLTKVFNRRALTSYLGKVCSRKDKTHDLYLLILDIDDFKYINDVHGHVAGDKILIFISNILRKTLRDGDKIFRYGGEEFIITLNRIDSKHCIEIVNRLLDLVRGNKLIYKGEGLNVTMSIGVTKLRINDTTDTVIARADKELYKAKNNGKNQMHSDIL